jgi:hypothetical protein
VPRTRLEIRCTGRKVNPLTNRPYGRICNKVFASDRPYRSRNDWLERARAAGWRVSPPRADKTVNACCPDCSACRKPGKKGLNRP